MLLKLPPCYTGVVVRAWKKEDNKLNSSKTALEEVLSQGVTSVLPGYGKTTLTVFISVLEGISGHGKTVLTMCYCIRSDTWPG